MLKLKDIIQLLRIKHWIKNILVIIPLFFSVSNFNYNALFNLLFGLLSFCLISSAVYIFNDICDVEKDKTHEIKCKRPIASGKVSIKLGYIVMLILIVISLGIDICLVNSKYSIFFLLGYLILNILYSVKLKNVPILDIIILVSGFIIRVLYGAIITKVIISKWLYLCVMSASFFMGFGKRRNEMLKQTHMSRIVLQYYSQSFLDKFMYVSLILTLVFYALWSIDPTTINRYGNEYITYTIPLVLIILMKYCLNIEGNSYGDPVDILMSDRILIILIMLYATSLISIIYLL